METESNSPKSVSIERAFGFLFGMIIAIAICGEMAAMTSVDNIWSPDWSKFDWDFGKVMLGISIILFLVYRVFKKLGWE